MSTRSVTFGGIQRLGSGSLVLMALICGCGPNDVGTIKMPDPPKSTEAAVAAEPVPVKKGAKPSPGGPKYMPDRMKGLRN